MRKTNAMQNDLYYLGVARALGDVVVHRLAKWGLRGIVELDESANDLKGAHLVDASLHEDFRQKIEGLELPAAVHFEGSPAVVRPQIEYVAYIDTIDGSTNCDRWVGDPAFVVAITRNCENPRYGDLEFGYVQGLVSGDYYYILGGRAYYFSAFHRKVYECDCRQGGVEKLEDAVTYINLGYGRKYGAHAARIVGRFVDLVFDVRGFDNSAIELCHIARNAAHLRIECRGGSEGANLLAAVTILRAAGGSVRDLDGNPLEDHPVRLDEKVDYVAGSNVRLVEAAIRVLKG